MKKLFLDAREPYLQIPSDVPPKYLLSLRNKEIFLMGLNFYSALTPRSRLKKKILRGSYGILYALAKSGLVHVSEDIAINRIRSVLKNQSHESHILNAYVPSSGKAIIQILKPSGACQKVIKMAFDAIQRRSLENEKKNIESLRDYRFESFEVPRVLDSSQTDNMFVVEYSCPERYRPSERFQPSLDLARLLSEMFVFGRSEELPIVESALFSEIKKRIELGGDDDLIRWFEFLAKRLRPQPVRSGLVHYDFKPWNILLNLTTNRPFIVDWELMRGDGFPLWDAYCYVLFTFFALYCDVQPKAADRHFYEQNKFFTAYVNALNIDVELITKLLPLYFLDILTVQELWNRWETEETRPKRIYFSMKRYLSHICEQLTG